MILEKEFLNMIMNDLKKSARFFKDSDAILRSGKGCPAKELHKKGIKVLDDTAMMIHKRKEKL